LLDGRSVLLTQDRALHNLAIGRGFQSMTTTPRSGLTDRRLAHVAVSDRLLPVASGALRDSYKNQADPEARAITGCVSGFLSAHQLLCPMSSTLRATSCTLHKHQRSC
jgi:hypothetical protein